MLPRSSQTPTYRWVCLGVLFLSAFLAFSIRLAPAVALPNLQITFGLTAAELSLLAALYLWPFALMQPVAGILTDRLGPRRSVTIFLMIAGLGQLLLAMAPNFAVALLGRACTGIGASILYVAAAKIMAQWFRRREFGTLTGAWTSVANLGCAHDVLHNGAVVLRDYLLERQAGHPRHGKRERHRLTSRTTGAKKCGTTGRADGSARRRAR